MSSVVIVEDSTGFFQRRTYSFNIPASAPGATTIVTQNFDFARLIWRAILHPSIEQKGDTISLCINPNQLIGSLALAANATDTVITVDASAAANVWVGEYLIFNDVTLETVQIKSYSGVSVTLCTPLQNAHAASTLLGMSVKLVDHMYLDGKNEVILAGKGVRGQQLPTDSQGCLEYTNSSGRPKVWNLTMEYYTGF